MTIATLKPMRLPALLAVASLLVGLLAAVPVRAHDPIFGVVPDACWFASVGAWCRKA